MWRGRRWAGGSRPSSLARPPSWAPSVGSCGPSLSGSGRSWLSAQTAFPRSAFAEEQKLRKHEIVRRILKEEVEEGRRKQRPSPPRPAGRPILRARTWSYVAAFHAGKSTAGPPCCPAVSGRPCYAGPHRPAQIRTTDSAPAPPPLRLGAGTASGLRAPGGPSPGARVRCPSWLPPVSGASPAWGRSPHRHASPQQGCLGPPYLPADARARLVTKGPSRPRGDVCPRPPPTHVRPGAGPPPSIPALSPHIEGRPCAGRPVGDLLTCP